MRRTDRAMDEAFALEIIDEADYGVVSFEREGMPYGIPLSLVRDGRRLLFHTAKTGRKFDFIKDGAPVWAVFVSRVKVPELFSAEELDAMAGSPSKAANLISTVFTTEYASAMAGGTVHELFSYEEKANALERVCRKYTPDQMKFVQMAITSGINLTRVFEIRMEEITAKRKKFDALGKEMKFGRTE